MGADLQHRELGTPDPGPSRVPTERPRHDVIVYLRDVTEPLRITGLPDAVALDVRDALTEKKRRRDTRFFELDFAGRQYRIRYKDVRSVVVDTTPASNPWAEVDPGIVSKADQPYMSHNPYGEFS